MRTFPSLWLSIFFPSNQRCVKQRFELEENNVWVYLTTWLDFIIVEIVFSLHYDSVLGLLAK